MSIDRRRNKHNRKPKKVILISYEGNNKTEKNYFDNFSGRNKEFVIKSVPGNETDPINLVKQTIKQVKSLALVLSDDDMAFCVFDTDTTIEKNKQIDVAIKLAKKHKIVPIISSPCVEIWFLLHYEYTTSVMSNEDVINKLVKHYSKYEKNCNIYEDLKDKTLIAIKNAKKLEKYQKENDKILQKVETNPYTEMYKIIEILKKL
jgi:predicted small metal-binding protein